MNKNNVHIERKEPQDSIYLIQKNKRKVPYIYPFLRGYMIISFEKHHLCPEHCMLGERFWRFNLLEKIVLMVLRSGKLEVHSHVLKVPLK